MRYIQGFAVALLALLLAGNQAIAQSPTLPRVLGQAAHARAPSSASDVATVRSRSVTPDLLLLDTIARRHARTGERTRFVIDLFPDLELTAEVIGADVRPGGGTTLYTRLPDVELASAVFTLEGGVLTASVDMPQGNYVVTPQADGTHAVTRKDSTRYAPEREPRQAFGRAQPADPFAASQAASPDVPTDSGRLIDVMVVWTPAAETAAGGLIAMQNLAQAAIDSANAVYLNSGVAQRLRLVHGQQVSYTERSNCPGANPFDCALDDVTGNGDGYIDTVHALRNTHGADLVAMLISDYTYCGLAWFLSTTSGDPAHGFSVTDQGCAVGNKSFAHELGHNMGADHDPANAFPSPPAAFPYNRGYIQPGSQWRTVMAYGGPCAGCTRIAHMSNPRDLFAGAVTGSANVSNNAHVLNKTAKAIANYRATSALHPVPQRFSDVPAGHAFFGHIEFMAQAGIASGCTAGSFCPDTVVTRRQMAAFLERPMRASNWVPPTTTTAFADVVAGSQFAGHIEAMRTDSITAGCASSPVRYCPEDAVTRGQMAVFVLRARCGGSYVPNMPASQTFADVPLSHPFVRYIHKMYSLGITGGCATGPLRYCPDGVVTRGQMAAFIERAYPFLTPSEVCSL